MKIIRAGVNEFLQTRGFQLLTDDELPPNLREFAITRGYRPPCSTVKQCMLSIFFATNETLNFWTHFIPSVYFTWKFLFLNDSINFLADPYTWPFVSYMITVCLYPLISSLAHAFFSMSSLARHIWFFLDYAGLSYYSYGAGLLYTAYTFPSDLLYSWSADIFLLGSFILAWFCTVLACCTRFVQHTFLIKLFRLGAFALPWLWDSVPLFYRLFWFYDLESPADIHYLRQFGFSFLIGFFYASHLPERLAPGKFDIIGNSHQLLHICGVMASSEQMTGALYDLQRRKEHLISAGHVVSSFWTVRIFGFLFFANCATVGLFSYYAWQQERVEQKHIKAS